MSVSHPERDDAFAQGQPLVRVLAAVVRRGDRLLVCRRPASKRHGGLWEFPGGKLEPDESLIDAARRELFEELGVQAVDAGSSHFTCRDPGSRYVIEFVDVTIAGEPLAHEHDELRWVTLADATTLALAPADAAFVRWMATQAT